MGLGLTSLASLAVLTSLGSAWSPTNGYAPGIVACPDHASTSNDSHSGFLRQASGISSQEAAYMEERDKITLEHLRTFLSESDYSDFDTDSYLDSITSNSSAQIPRFGLAFSGGGYRALLCAAGQISALDNRTEGTNEHGLPLLDAASYISGLSGGSWFLSSLLYNNWTSVQSIVNTNGQDNAIWDFEHTILAPYGINIIKNGFFWDDLSDWVDDKRDAGFEVSLTDPWGRGLSKQFFPTMPEYGAAMLFSDMQEYPIFQNHSIPFPIVVADGRLPGTKIINGNSTIFEFNPYEMGCWDTYVDAFAELKYVGTPMSEGKVSGNGSCWSGLDNVGFVFGTSSTLFNQFLLQLNSTSLSGEVYNLAHDLLTDFDNSEDDIAPWYPNPFMDSPYGSSHSLKDNDTLFLVDGGEDLQNIPLWPLLQESRELDAIIAFDNSADTDIYWPDFASLVATYERQSSQASNGVAVPYMPGIESMAYFNLTARPTFFGCYASNLTTLMDQANVSVPPPLIIAIGNRPWSYNSNTSTFKLDYSDDEKLSMIRNGFEVASFNNMTVDADFRRCVGCAILQRSKERMGTEIGDECQKCFDTYCWDGQIHEESNYSFPDTFTDWGAFNSTVAREEGIDVAAISSTVSVISTTSHSKNGANHFDTVSHGRLLGAILALSSLLL